jgi:hypothetical protein
VSGREILALAFMLQAAVLLAFNGYIWGAAIVLILGAIIAAAGGSSGHHDG